MMGIGLIIFEIVAPMLEFISPLIPGDFFPYYFNGKIEMLQRSLVDLNMVTIVARLLVDKGIREFIDASRILNENGTKATFWIVGDIDEGNQKSVTREEIASWKQLPNVRFFGFQENIADLYSKSNIACLPSYREGLPKSLVEAAACGRAVVGGKLFFQVDGANTIRSTLS